MGKTSLISGFLFFAFFSSIYSQSIIVDGNKQYQAIHGLGVNVNPQSWNVNSSAVKSVLDSLISGMGCTSFRLMFDDCDWETVNDNDDPDSYNWNYYDSVYSAPRFMGIWEMIRYLNDKGIVDITLSPNGASPDWMGGTTLTSGKEEEYAEMITSMVYYARKRLQHPVQFIMLSPVNETDGGGREGVVVTPAQFEKVYGAVASHLIRGKLDEITIVGPDDAGGRKENLHAMLGNATTMKKVKYFGSHAYGNSSAKSREYLDIIKGSAYPDRELIVTEVNEICNGFNCDGGVYNPDYGFDNYAGPAYKYILQHLNAGVSGIQVWEAYDSRYHHPHRYLTWSMWGIFAVNDTIHPDVYTKRAHYDVLKQLFKFVRPGFKRIDVSTTLVDFTVSAFRDTAKGTTVITGMNNSGNPQTLDGILKNLPTVSKLRYYYSDASHNFAKGSDVKISSQTFSKIIPAKCVFTLVAN